MTDDDDALSAHEAFQTNVAPFAGKFRGGPLDGGEFSIEIEAHLALRGMTLNVCIGEERDDSEWHRYFQGQTMTEDYQLVNFFEHQGVVEAGPK